MSRSVFLIYGIANYLIFLAATVYSIGFMGNVVVPRSIDSGPSGPPGVALLVDAILLSIFALQHSIMARPAFKSWWTRVIPQAIERSTYVLLSSLVIFLMIWQWRPIQNVIWTVEDPIGSSVLSTLHWIGWLLAIVSTFLIDHFEFFGVKQVFLHFSGKPYTATGFKIPSLYRYVRHPIMLGFITAFWATPRMTAGHLVFAIASTAYILVALQFEERDLIKTYGDTYRAYKQKVPMLLPWPRKKA